MTALIDQLPAVLSPEVNLAIVPVPANEMPLAAHPAAMLFPLLQGAEFGALVEDIEVNGLREPIVLYQGVVLDGRNRLRACDLAGVPPRFIEWDGVGSPLAFIVSRNLRRRHLNESQRSILGAQVKAMFEEEAAERRSSTLAQFADTSHANPTGVVDDENHREIPVFANLQKRAVHSHIEAAELVNVSPRSVSTASKVLESGDPEVIDAIVAGDISVSDAAAVVDLPKDAQRQALETVRSGGARTLRQAARIEPDEEAPSSKERDDAEQPFSRKRLRLECKRFTAELDRLLRRLDTVTSACGGPNDYTRRVRDCLNVALRAIHECVNELGKTKR